MWLLLTAIVFCVAEERKVERTASLVVLPPLVIGYEDLYEQAPEETPEPAKELNVKNPVNNNDPEPKEDKLEIQKTENVGSERQDETPDIARAGSPPPPFAIPNDFITINKSGCPCGEK